MYIVKPELDDQAVQQEIEKVGQLIQTNGGQVKKVTPWGKRRLAYTVKDHRQGQAGGDLRPVPAQGQTRLHRRPAADALLGGSGRTEAEDHRSQRHRGPVPGAAQPATS